MEIGRDHVPRLLRPVMNVRRKFCSFTEGIFHRRVSILKFTGHSPVGENRDGY